MTNDMELSDEARDLLGTLRDGASTGERFTQGDAEIRTTEPFRELRAAGVVKLHPPTAAFMQTGQPYPIAEQVLIEFTVHGLNR